MTMLKILLKTDDISEKKTNLSMGGHKYTRPPFFLTSPISSTYCVTFTAKTNLTTPHNLSLSISFRLQVAPKILDLKNMSNCYLKAFCVILIPVHARKTARNKIPEEFKRRSMSSTMLMQISYWTKRVRLKMAGRQDGARVPTHA